MKNVVSAEEVQELKHPGPFVTEKGENLVPEPEQTETQFKAKCFI